MDSDNFITTGEDQLSANSSENGVSNGTTLHAIEELTTTTSATIGEQVPFFLDAGNHTLVAEEVEIETSSVGVCENITTADNEVMKYSCEITLTYSDSPVPSGSTEHACEFADGDAENNQSMQIIWKPCATSSTDTNGHVDGIDDEIRIANGMFTDCEPTTTQPMLSEDEQIESTEENLTASLVTNTVVSIAEPVCVKEPATAEEKEDDEEEDAVVDEDVTANKDMMNDDDCLLRTGRLSSRENDVSLSKDKNDDIDEDLDVPVRVSCIQWARKMQAELSETSDNVHADITEGPVATSSAASGAVDANSPNGGRLKTTLPYSPTDNEDNWDEDDHDQPGFSEIWVPEITTTTIEDEEVQIVEVPLSEAQGKSDIPCCFHPCCAMMREVWSCLPWWFKYTRTQACFKSRRSRRPPGFEDPPEEEWVVVNVNQIDPSDGALRYKCRNCEGYVQYRSTKQKFQLNYSRLKYQCSQCNRKYFTKKQLKLHSMRHNEKRRVCPYCDKRFLTRNELQNHLNTHTRERPYQCPVCFQRFAHTSRYYSHIRNIHKKYDCSDCFAKVCSLASRSTNIIGCTKSEF